mmetsp:Transcript_1228/g.1743  ORF Transcript_1228/g.1743 Transcript_1228/m.1743 type:complete len:251 (-) Transcript_1228:15-767(-)
MGKKSHRVSKKSNRMKDIKRKISDANALKNPFQDLSPMLVRMNVPLSSGESVNENEIAKEIDAQVQFHHSPLPAPLHDACLQLFQTNMTDMYKSSSWGLDMKEKENEFQHPDARFLILTPTVEYDSHQQQQQLTSNSKATNKVLAFAHFRFEIDDEDDPLCAIAYLYELQVDSSARRAGIGRRLTSIVELIAKMVHMKMVRLTVFKSNLSAMHFYTNKMKYSIDDISPSNYEDNVDVDYEILCKSLQPKI